MSALTDILRKREAGALADALKLAQKALAKSPDDLEIKEAMAGVYLDYLKLATADVDNVNYEEGQKWFKAYVALDLPLSEEPSVMQEQFKNYHRRIHKEYARMQEANKLSKSGKHMEALAIYDEVLLTLEDYTVAFVNVGWCLYRLLAEIAPKPQADEALVDKCLTMYRQFDIHGPSNLHSQMLRIVLYFKDYQDVDVVGFIEWWNFDLFREEDLTPFRANGGNTIPSLRERAYLTYAKLLIEGLREDAPARGKITKFSESFLPLLDATLPELPRNVWLPYARMRLLIQLGHGDEVEAELISIIRSRANEFWAWAALAEVYRGDDDGNALGCYCKSLLLPAQGELAIHVRENLSLLLIKYELYNEAKSELDMIIEARAKKHWKISLQIQEWRRQPWYRTARAPMTNKSFYIRNAPKADMLLWNDIPDSIAVVTHVDMNKGAFYYAVNKRIGGKHLMKGAAARVKIGDILALKLREMETAGNVWYKVAGLRLETEKLPEEITQWVDEYVQIPRGRDFGFLKPSNIYVAPDIVNHYGLFDGQRVQGVALLSFNKQKNDWTWKLLTVEQAY